MSCRSSAFVLIVLSSLLPATTAYAQSSDPRVELEQRSATEGEEIISRASDPFFTSKSSSLSENDSSSDEEYDQKRAGAEGQPGGEPAEPRAAPVNDLCEDAISVSDGTTAFSTTGATNAGITDTICNFGFVDGGAVNSDIWYKWVSGVDGRARVSLCGSAYDTKLAIYEGTCPVAPDEAIACDEDLCNPGLQSLVAFNVTSGQTYLIRIGGYNGEQGSGTMNITSGPIPENDECENAVVLSCEGTAIFSNLFATENVNDPPIGCFTGGANRAIGTMWYKFVSPHGSVQIKTCNSTGATDTLIALYDGDSGCPISQTQELGCGEDECGVENGRLSSICIGSIVPGRTYYVQVGVFEEASRGEIQLDLTCPCPVGPDVIVGSLFGCCAVPSDSGWNTVKNWGRIPSSGGITGYSVGTISCNPGDVPVSWNTNNNKHPVIGQQLYRFKNGRFEQVGMSWVKHGFLALSEDWCSLGCIEPENGAYLGIGCSDPYTNDLNGTTTRLGPRGHINAFTGSFAYPSNLVPYPPPAAPATVGRRLQVKDADVSPALNVGAKYFIEGHYITSDDATLGNGLNNATYREVTVSNPSGVVYNLTLTGADFRMMAGILAWQEQDPQVVNTIIDVPAEGRFVLAANATDLGGGIWHYEYALYNYNSDRSGASFTVPIPTGVAVTNAGFHDVDYHSGDSLGFVSGAIDNTDWLMTVGAGSVTWSTTSYASNPKANALRWATLYNFRFDAAGPPTTGDITIGLFKPGSPSSISGSTIVPDVPPPLCDCPGDADENGVLDGRDIDAFVPMYLELTAISPCAEVVDPATPPLDDNDTVEFVTRLLDGNCPPP